MVIEEIEGSKEAGYGSNSKDEGWEGLSICLGQNPSDTSWKASAQGREEYKGGTAEKT